jgi:hypothetical protein
MKNSAVKSFGKFLIVLVSALIFVNLFGDIVIAQNTPGPAESSSFNVNQYLTIGGQPGESSVMGTQAAVGESGIGGFLVKVINFLSLSIGSFALVALIIGGITLLTSGGREAALTRGKDIIKYAIIGLAAALSAYIITSAVQGIFFENLNR